MEQSLHTAARKIEQWPGGGFWLFVIKQAWAALFGGLLLIAIVVTEYIDLPWFARYDWLFFIALSIQLFMLVTKLEKPHEVVTILLFHLVGLGMEIFKTSADIGSWSYPGEAFFRVENVPLFFRFYVCGRRKLYCSGVACIEFDIFILSSTDMDIASCRCDIR